MLTAKQVAQMIECNYIEPVAHGYTPERYTISIFYDEIHEEFIRYESQPGGTYVDQWLSGLEFNPDLFTSNVKRWYEDRTNHNLVELFKTFGTTLPLV